LNPSAGSESREFDIAGWSFVARPVGASASACLACHNNRHANGAAGPSVDGTTEEPFRLGDPLGAVLYGYQSVRTPC
jgi:hypothetical protein